MLKRARRRKGLSRHAVARRAGTSTSYLAKLERSERLCSTVVAAELADALGLNLAERAVLMEVAADNAGRSRKPSAEPQDPARRAQADAEDESRALPSSRRGRGFACHHLHPFDARS